jgi:hypothetical protein
MSNHRLQRPATAEAALVIAVAVAVCAALAPAARAQNPDQPGGVEATSPAAGTTNAWAGKQLSAPGPGSGVDGANQSSETMDAPDPATAADAPAMPPPDDAAPATAPTPAPPAACGGADQPACAPAKPPAE